MLKGSRTAGARGAAILVCLGAGMSLAQIGGESGAYLRVPVGATACALGGANTASPSYLASWYDPAVLASYKTRVIALGMGVASLGQMDGYGDFSFRIPSRVGIETSLLYRGDPSIDNLYDDNGDPISGSAAYTTLTFKAGLSYLISRKWSAGLGFGVFYQSLPTSLSSSGAQNSSVTGIGGFCLALHYQPTTRLALALVVRNLALAMNWQFESDDYGYVSSSTDKPIPELALGAHYQTTLFGKPFIWTSDILGYIVDGDWARLPHSEAVLNNGFEWRRWETFYLRLGLGDLSLSSKMFYNTSDYFDTFTMRVTGGFAWDLRYIHDGLWLNYAIGSDKIGALFDQMLDIELTF